MSELGGAYQLTLTVSNGDDTTDAAVTVVDPLGATSTPDVDGSGVTWSAVISPLTSAGWYLAQWTVTGTGQGVKSQRFYVTPTPTSWGVWPPCLADLKLDLEKAFDDQDDSSDAAMSIVLEAAIARVRKLKGHQYALGGVRDDGESGESGAGTQAPTADLILGTVRQAQRWVERRRSADGTIYTGDIGVGRIPAFDPDLERLLEIGRFTRPQDSFA